MLCCVQDLKLNTFKMLGEKGLGMKKELLLISTVVLLSGCAPTIIGGGAYVGTAAISEKGLTGEASDTAISTGIRMKLFNKDPELYYGISVTVENGEVMVGGVAASEELHADVIRLVWEVKGVKRVIDNISTQGDGITTFAQDSWITTKVKSNLLFDKNIMSVNYSVVTSKGTVYVMGIAQNQAELNRVTYHASRTDGVKKVVSYARLKDAPAEAPLPASE